MCNRGTRKEYSWVWVSIPFISGQCVIEELLRIKELKAVSIPFISGQCVIKEQIRGLAVLVSIPFISGQCVIWGWIPNNGYWYMVSIPFISGQCVINALERGARSNTVSIPFISGQCVMQN